MKPHFPTRTDARRTSNYGWRTHPVSKKRTHHDGIDLAPKIAGTRGVPVYATAGGIVRNREYHSISGNRIYIEHTDDNKTSVYLHLASFNVKKGDRVKRGQQIGIMGTTGSSTGIHLHFGISTRYPVSWGSNGSFIDPLKYLNTNMKGDKTMLKVDGYLGKKTIQRLQEFLGTPEDGVISKPSTMVRELQEFLNKYGK